LQIVYLFVRFQKMLFVHTTINIYADYADYVYDINYSIFECVRER